MTTDQFSKDFSCPMSFRSQLLLSRIENNMTMATCYVADPLDADGTQFSLSSYTSWQRPDDGEWDFDTKIVERKLGLEAVALRFHTEEKAKGLSPTIDGSDDIIGQLSIIAMEAKLDTVAPKEMSFLATIPHMVDAMALYDFMPLKHANGFQRVVNGRPIGEGNTDRRILLRVQEIQRRETARTAAAEPSNQLMVVQPAALQPLRRMMPLQPAKPRNFLEKIWDFLENFVSATGGVDTYAGSISALKSPPPLLHLNGAPYTDAEDLLFHVGDDKEVLAALLQGAEKRMPDKGYQRDLWNLMELDQDPTPDAVRICYALLNYEIDRTELEKYANGMLESAHEAYKSHSWQWLNSVIENPSQGSFYKLALLKTYYQTASGKVPDQLAQAWTKPFTRSEDAERPTDNFVRRCLENKLVPLVLREAQTGIDAQTVCKWSPDISAEMKTVQANRYTESGDFVKKAFWTSRSGYSISNTGKLTIHDELVGGLNWAQAECIACKPTAMRCYEYNKATWWEPTRMLANLRPDLIRPEDRAAPARPLVRIPGVDGVPRLAQGELVQPVRPISNGQFVKFPGGKIGELEL